MTDLNILLSSGGRRIGLMECLRDALRDNGVQGKLLVTDSSLDAPAIHLADRSWTVTRCSDPSFVTAVLAIAIREQVKVIVPTIDSELLPFAENSKVFRAHGIFIQISDPITVRICRDKVLTHKWLVTHGFPTVRQCAPESALANPDDWKLPLVMKPRDGSASKGVRIIRSHDELRSLSELDDSLIVQDIAPGAEYTINVFVDQHGQCVCAVPHQRLEVRSGEVSKAVTVKDPQVMNLGARIAEALPGARGMLNIQCFKSDRGDLKVIEINARVGGGYPVAHCAGARFTHWLIEEYLGRPSTAEFDKWQDDLAMLRYDEAIFRPGSAIRRTDLAALIGSERPCAEQNGAVSEYVLRAQMDPTSAKQFRKSNNPLVAES